LEYDVIVVGAGPGGSAAAYFLADAGFRVAVLEKKKFPRPKTCGDGLTPRAIKVLNDIGLTNELGSYQKVKGLRVRGGGRTLDLEWPRPAGFPPYGMVRRRRDLDWDIAQRATTAGAEYHFGTEAVAPLFESSVVTGVRWVKKAPQEGGGVRKVDEGKMHAPFVVVADGASSPFGRALGVTRNPGFPLGLAIRTYYASHRHDDDYFESWLELRKGDELLPGYGWIFPVGDGTVNVGVGLLTTFGQWRSVNLNHLQRDFIDMFPKSYGITHDSQTEPYQSGRLPMGGSLQKPYGAGYVVIGDAAGMVNPFNGEGIAYALETAKLASGLIAQQLRTGNSAELSEYRAALHDLYGSYYRIGRRFVKFIGNPRAFRALCQVGMRSQTIMEFVFQVLANLGTEKGGSLGDRGFRALVRLAERELPDLKEPEIPEIVSADKKKVGAA
jgi:geranylgeranyl reductase family protein